ncbi:hypothetical protein [Naasia sp. SYSU D00057]|uniref:hypothetical protein n=1 Tax=Naasia sp. SYSU D00057 TaxID=2817380 RepID=UPI001B318229|nr:hypothetical protein [Naasia sp. SYSU D00057]
MSRIGYRGLLFVLVTGGLSVAGVSAATAAETDGSHSVGGGNQLLPMVSAPVDVVDNAVAVLGNATTTAATGGSSTGGAGPVGSGPTTDGTGSVLGGNQIAPVVSVPITVSGNSVSVLGDADAGSAPAGTAQPVPPTGTAAETDGSGSLAGGNQIAPNLASPVSVGGNAVSVLGDATAEQGQAAPAGTAPTGHDLTTDGRGSLLGGNQVAPDLRIPVTVAGNALGILRDAEARPVRVVPGTSHAATPGAATSDGRGSLLGGNQLLPVLHAPLTIAGNGIGLLGAAPSVLPHPPLHGGGLGIDVGTVGSPTIPGAPTSPGSPTTPGAPATPGAPVDGRPGSAVPPFGIRGDAVVVVGVEAGMGAGSSVTNGAACYSGTVGGGAPPVTPRESSHHGSGAGSDDAAACTMEHASTTAPIPGSSTTGVLSLALGVLLTLAGAALVLRKRMS